MFFILDIFYCRSEIETPDTAVKAIEMLLKKDGYLRRRRSVRMGNQTESDFIDKNDAIKFVEKLEPVQNVWINTSELSTTPLTIAVPTTSKDTAPSKTVQPIPSTSTTTPSSLNTTTSRTTLRKRPTSRPIPPEKKTFEFAVTNSMGKKVTGLTHFTEYTIEVSACQNQTGLEKPKEPCSYNALTTVRTLPLAGADDIDQSSIIISIDNSTRVTSRKFSKVHLRWAEPTHPNGYILNYEVEFRRITSEPFKLTAAPVCVSRLEYLSNKNGTLIDILSGSYEFRIRARSLAQYGNWTQSVNIHIQEPGSDVRMFVTLALLMVVILVIFFVILYHFRRRFSKLDYVSVNPEYLSAGFDYQPDPKWEIQREMIKIIKELGQGSFGMVYEGELKQVDSEGVEQWIKCAVKTVNENANVKEKFDFIKEANVMK